jgi:hypothetical protein
LLSNFATASGIGSDLRAIAATRFFRGLYDFFSSVDVGCFCVAGLPSVGGSLDRVAALFMGTFGQLHIPWIVLSADAFLDTQGRPPFFE